tara:strand:- start:983 stop:1447 length:465 start_codon:yes stop_codon:yes gene_type:complete
MARITVEDCLKKIDNQYDLVLLAKERTTQLNAGDAALVPQDNDKNTVVSLREIGEGKISVKTLEDSAINKLRKQQEQSTEIEDLEGEKEDSFDKLYKGEISKSGTAVLPSKRMRRMPLKTNVSTKPSEKNDDLNDEKIEELAEEESKSTDNKAE